MHTALSMHHGKLLAPCALSALVGFAAGRFVLPESRDSPREGTTRSTRSEDFAAAEREEPKAVPPAPAPEAPPPLALVTPAPTSSTTAVVSASARTPAQPVARAEQRLRDTPGDGERAKPTSPVGVSRAALLSAFRFAGMGPHGGVRLGRVTAGTLPDLLGLKTGDEIITLNGLRIAEPQQALLAYARLPYTDDWVATISRGGTPTEIRYALR